jgi:hypothetical protein
MNSSRSSRGRFRGIKRTSRSTLNASISSNQSNNIRFGPGGARFSTFVIVRIANRRRLAAPRTAFAFIVKRTSCGTAISARTGLRGRAPEGRMINGTTAMTFETVGGFL